MTSCTSYGEGVFTLARSFEIGGVDRTADYIGHSLKIERALSYAIDACTLKVRGTAPAWGDEVTVADGATVLFSGICLKPSQVDDMPGHETQVWQVDCHDYTALLAGREVTEVYESMTADAIFLDLATKYAPAFTTTGVQSGGPTVDYLAFADTPLPDCFKKLCEISGWQWFPDYARDLHFYALVSGGAAPLVLIPDGRFTGFGYAVDIQGIRNRVKVRGGSALSEPFTHSFVADGTRRQWSLPHKPHDITLTVDGVAKTVGIEHVHDEAAFDYLMNFEQAYIMASAQTVTPVAGTALAVVYTYDIPVIAQADDEDSQALLAAALGTTGVFEHTVTDDTINTLEAAMERAAAELREWANPRTTVTFSTEVTGWAPGQIVSVNLPDRGVVGDFLVQEADVEASTAEHFTTYVSAGSTIFGLADFFRRLSVDGTGGGTDDRPLVDRFQSAPEDMTLAEAFTDTTGTSAVGEIGTAIIGFSEVG